MINPQNGICPYDDLLAKKIWSKACNYHRGRDVSHICGNPYACQKRLNEAFSQQMSTGGFI